MIRSAFGFCTPSLQNTPVNPSTLQYILVPCTLKDSVYPVTITFHKQIWELQIGVFAIPMNHQLFSFKPYQQNLFYTVLHKLK